MAVLENSAPDSLSALADSLASAASAFPAIDDGLLPPTDGISLLDTKNELLLSYIQNLVFLIILKLRDGPNTALSPKSDLRAEVVKELVELRVYMERGVRPLEGRLKYQIDKVLHAANDAERSAPRAINSESKRGKTATKEGANNDGSQTSESDAENSPPPLRPDELSYRPNPAALLRKTQASGPNKPSTRKDATYRPPRITPTAMPQAGPTSRDTNASRRDRKSRLLDEYVSSELSSAPLAEPSIGSNSTILNRGRGSLSARERERQRERTEYEETNLARLPGESKAERRKANVRGEGVRRNQYGGEDWAGLGEVGDRVARSVGRRKDGPTGVLQRREKRRRDESDNVRNSGGTGIGDAFEKRRRVLQERSERKTRRGR